VWVTDVGFVAEMADELGGPPTLAEFLEVLGWAAADGGPSRFTVTLADGKPYRSELPSRVPDLDDNVFAEASEYAHGLDTAGVLADLRGGRIILADVEPDEIGGLTVETPKKRVAKPKPGDVVGIPVAGGYRPAVVLVRNHFGTALGLFAGTSPNGQVGRLRSAPGRPVYTEESLIKDGTWPVVDHDESLLELFPADPPIYHKPNAWPGIDTGEFGAAETADGTMTPIGPDEAREIGLTDGTYRQTMHAAFLQKQLDDR
jgi:hypothetical protein